MADKDLEGDGPSLELPSFGFGRKKRGDRSESTEAPQAAEADETDLPAPTEPEPAPEPREQPTQVLSAQQAPTRVDEHEAGDEPATRTAAREIHFPTLPALPAVLLVGAAVGLAAVLLTWGSLRLCDVATGTASCGGGPGLLLLVAIMIALTYLGGWLLRGFGISDAGSTSFLAVGLLAVVAMLFLVDSLDEWTGALAVPVVTVLAYALSWRVTATLVDAGADQQ